MVGNWQGPASFEAVLKEAAARAKEQEARTEALKEARRREVYGDAMPQKYKRKTKQGAWGRPKKGDRLLTPHAKYILDKRNKNMYLSEIVRDLKRDFGVSVCTETLSKFIRECQKND